MLREEGKYVGGPLLLKSICTDLTIPLTVGYIVHTSTTNVSGAKEWIKEVAKAAGGFCKANRSRYESSSLVAPTP